MKLSLRTSVILITIASLLALYPTVVWADGGQIDKGLLEAISPYLQSILEIVLTALAATAAYYVRQYMVQLVVRIRQNTSTEVFWLIRNIVDTLVAAAQQIYENSEGDLKKQYVLEHAQEELAKYGLKLDLTTLDALIEAAVWEKFKKPIWDAQVTALSAGGVQAK